MRGADGRWQIAAHPAAELFPLIEGQAFMELVKDVSEHGLRDAIVLDAALEDGGRVLDGRNRLRACNMSGREPSFVVFQGDDPIAFVVSKNIKRRHLTESQIAMVAAALMPMFEAEAAERQRAGAEKGRAARRKSARSPLTEREEAAIAADAAALAAEANAPDPEVEPLEEEAPRAPVRARAQAAAAVGHQVSERTIESAASVLERGAPELVAAVNAGQVSVAAAVDIATLPAAKQAEVIKGSPKEILAAAKAVRAEREEASRAARSAKIAAQSARNEPLEGSPGRLYSVVYADPPWRYDAPISASRAIERQYPTLTLEELCALPVPSILTEDAIVFLWVTAPMDVSGEAAKLVEAWGLKVVSKTVWVKDSEDAVLERGAASRAGMGRWQRVDHELLYWCMRGTMPTPSPALRPSSVLYRPRAKHSEKPDEIAELIERLYPGLPRVELFARGARPGWDVWGNESTGRVSAGSAA